MKKFLNKVTFQAILRGLLSTVGAILIAAFANEAGFIEETIGAIILLSSMIWSIVEKDGSPIEEKIEGLWRHVVGLIIAFLVKFGGDNSETAIGALNQATSLVVFIIPLIFSLISKNKKTQ